MLVKLLLDLIFVYFFRYVVEFHTVRPTVKTFKGEGKMCFCNRVKLIACVSSYNLEVLLYKVLDNVNEYVRSVSVAAYITSEHLSCLTMFYRGNKSTPLDEEWYNNSDLKSLFFNQYVLSSKNSDL